MPAKVALSPFNSSNWYDAINAPISSPVNGSGSYWDMGGWHYKRRNNWTKNPKKSHRVTRDTLIMPGTHTKNGKYVPGKKVYVYKAEGYDDYMSFYPHHDEAGGSSEANAMAYAEAAFSEETHDNVLESDGCGHIAHIKWAQRHQVMEVTFADGAICYFFRVPSAVFGTLYHFAQSKQSMPNSEHHMLGHVFWDLVRIRGQKHGARYPFEYVSHSVYQLTGSNARIFVKLDKKTMRMLNPNLAQFMREGDEISTILDGDEMSTLPFEVQKRINNVQGNVEHKGAGDSHKEEAGTGTDNKGSDITSEQFDDMRLQEQNKAHIESDKQHILSLKGPQQERAIREFIDEYGGAAFAEAFDTSRPDSAIINIKSMRNGMLSDSEAVTLDKIYSDFRSAEDARIQRLQDKAERIRANWIANHPDTYADIQDRYRKLPDLMRNAQIERAVLENTKLLSMYKNTKYEKDLFGLKRASGEWVFRPEYANPRLEPTVNDPPFNGDKEAFRQFKELRRRRNKPLNASIQFIGKGRTVKELESLRGKVDGLYDALLDTHDYQDALSHAKDLTQHLYKRGRYNYKAGNSGIADSSKYFGPNDYLKIDTDDEE